MQLTPEQEARIRREFVETPGSVLVTLTPDEDAALERAIDEEEAGKAENIARCLRLEELLGEDSLLGALRRAVEAAEMSYPELAAAAGLDSDRLRCFFWGDVDLPGEEIDRLAKALHLQLVPESAA